MLPKFTFLPCRSGQTMPEHNAEVEVCQVWGCSSHHAKALIVAVGCAAMQNFMKGNMTLGNDSNSPGGSAAAFSKLRIVPRYTFVATVEFTGSGDIRKSSGSVRNSRNGCYVDTMNVLPVGTSLEVSMSRGQETFATNGDVIYVLERRGMGIVFTDTPDEQLAILDYARRAIVGCRHHMTSRSTCAATQPGLYFS